MNKSLNMFAMNLGSDISQLVITAAVRLGLDRDGIYTILTTLKDEVVSPILLTLNDNSVKKAKIDVIVDKMHALRSRLESSHHVNLCLIDRVAIQGRDWQTDMISGVVHNLYIAKDIVDDGNVQAFDRIVSAIVPFFFGERSATIVSAEPVEEVPEITKENIPVATEAPTPDPVEELAKEEEPAPKSEPDTASTITTAIKNSIVEVGVDKTEEGDKTTSTTVTIKTAKTEKPDTKTIRRRPAIKVIR